MTDITIGLSQADLARVLQLRHQRAVAHSNWAKLMALYGEEMERIDLELDQILGRSLVQLPAGAVDLPPVQRDGDGETEIEIETEGAGANPPIQEPEPVVEIIVAQPVDQQPTANGQQPTANVPEAPTVPVETVLRPFYVGFHGRSDPHYVDANGMPHPFAPEDVDAMDKAKVDSMFLMTNQMLQSLDWLQGKFTPMRIYWNSQAMDQQADMTGYIAVFAEAMRPWYERGLRWFQVHNEMNLHAEGLGKHWLNGNQADMWLQALYRGLKREFPAAKLGWPALSILPQDEAGVGQSMVGFLNQMGPSLRMYDWIAVHAYWQRGVDTFMHSRTFGMSWKTVLDYAATMNNGFQKPALLTEFANTDPGVPHAVRAQQYLAYYQLLMGNTLNLQGAYAFHLNHMNRDMWPEQRIVGSGIPEVIGTR